MTVAENLVLARATVPVRVRLEAERGGDRGVHGDDAVPRRPLGPVRTLAAGEKQKLEILKQLYLAAPC